MIRRRFILSRDLIVLMVNVVVINEGSVFAVDDSSFLAFFGGGVEDFLVV